MPIIGWIAGTTWLTLPMSVLPALDKGCSACHCIFRPSASLLAANSSTMVGSLKMSSYGCPLWANSTVQPDDDGAASAIAVNRSYMYPSRSLVAARRYHSARVCDGMMFGASPPWVTIPWILSVGCICWREVDTFMYSWTKASRAFRPSHGAADAWASLPWKSTGMGGIAHANGA